MTKSQMLLTAALLDIAANQFSNHRCNDLAEDVENLLTQSEWDELNNEYHQWNGDPEEYTPGTILSDDWLWMGYMAEKLRKMAEEVSMEEAVESAALKNLENFGQPRDLFIPDVGWIMRDNKVTEIGIQWFRENFNSDGTPK